MVSSGPNVYILLSYDDFFDTGVIRLVESGLEYEPGDAYLISPHIYAAGKDGGTVLTATYVGNSLYFNLTTISLDFLGCPCLLPNMFNMWATRFPLELGKADRKVYYY